MDHQIPLSRLGEISRTRLCASILACRPKFLAFTSKTAGQKVLGGKRDYGEQIELIAETQNLDIAVNLRRSQRRLASGSLAPVRGTRESERSYSRLG